jgi:hypothetical protein
MGSKDDEYDYLFKGTEFYTFFSVSNFTPRKRISILCVSYPSLASGRRWFVLSDVLSDVVKDTGNEMSKYLSTKLPI